jgi:hypothetical protein
MNAETRMFEEWKVNNDLLKFYEDLKQKRFAHFLTIQTAFLAFFTLLAKEAIGASSNMSHAALMLVSTVPLVISFYFTRVDKRSRAFIDTINTRLLLIEGEWKAVAPVGHFSTHSQQFSILSQHDQQMIDRYVGARNVPGDGFRALTDSRSAHIAEHAVLQMFVGLWVLLSMLGATLHLVRFGI